MILNVIMTTGCIKLLKGSTRKHLIAIQRRLLGIDIKNRLSKYAAKVLLVSVQVKRC
jgi:hypothetical protein